MTLPELKNLNLPDTPGVYFFKKGKDILYIGKATSLQDRVKSYFSSDLIKTRGMLLVDMVTKAETVEYQETASVLEALLLETELIKTHSPYYNTKEKDDTSYWYVIVTKEEFATVTMMRGKDLERKDKTHYSHTFGPFVSSGQLKEALKIIRKIFPYKDEKCIANQGKPCFNASIGLCPGVCIGCITKKEYEKDIQKIVLFLQGNIKKIQDTLEKEMLESAKKLEFEKAEELKRKIFSITHIRDVSLITRDNTTKTREVSKDAVRIESYDIAHMQGQHMIGVMVVMENGVLVPGEYKKFIIKTVTRSNDAAALREVLTRRLTHTEWTMPNVIVMDGNEVQKKVAEDVFQIKDNQSISILSVVKDDRHKAKNILGIIPKTVSPEDIYKINAEAHRFAIAYFRRKQRRGMLR